jgi:hypothetical protein
MLAQSVPHCKNGQEKCYQVEINNWKETKNANIENYSLTANIGKTKQYQLV